MPRAKRPSRAADDHPVPDPAAFADDFCAQRGLVPAALIGTSDVEKECIRRAEEARQAYKDHRDDAIDRRAEEPSSERSGSPRDAKRQKTSGATIAADDSGLTPAQKYARRLFNNRKSAAASRVYAEVLKREQATVLQNSSLNDPASDVAELKCKVRDLEDERVALMAHNAALKQALLEQKKKTEDFERQVVRMGARRVNVPGNYERLRAAVYMSIGHPQVHKPQPQLVGKADDYRLLDDNHPALQLSSQEMELVNHHIAGHAQMPNQTQQSFGYSQPSASAYLTDQGGSQPHPMAQSTDQPQTESQSQAPSSNPNRLVVSKWSNSMALSPVANENDAKDFTTGLTCSQSQNEDGGDDKGPLVRTSMPMSAGLPINLLVGSQQSQELPGFKTPIGSEENPLGDTDLFMGSQGNSNGNAN